MKPKIVIDTNVVIAALKSRQGASNKLLQLFGRKKFIHNISVALILEYEDVMKRLLLNLDEHSINSLLDYICTTSQHTKIHYLWGPYLKNPKDDMVLELAVASESDFIVTFNKKDLKYAIDFGIKVVTPKELLIFMGELQ